MNEFAGHNKTQLGACLLLERNMLIMCTVSNLLPVNIGRLTCCRCVKQAYPSLISRDNQIHSLILWFENGHYFLNSVWCCRHYTAALSVIFCESHFEWRVSIGKVVDDGQRLLEAWTTDTCISNQLTHSFNHLEEKKGKNSHRFLCLLLTFNPQTSQKTISNFQLSEHISIYTNAHTYQSNRRLPAGVSGQCICPL